MAKNNFGIKAIKEEIEITRKLAKEFPDSVSVKGRLGGILYAAYMLDIITDEEYSEFMKECR